MARNVNSGAQESHTQVAHVFVLFLGNNNYPSLCCRFRVSDVRETLCGTGHRHFDLPCVGFPEAKEMNGPLGQGALKLTDRCHSAREPTRGVVRSLVSKAWLAHWTGVEEGVGCIEKGHSGVAFSPHQGRRMSCRSRRLQS